MHRGSSVVELSLSSAVYSGFPFRMRSALFLLLHGVFARSVVRFYRIHSVFVNANLA